MKFSTADWLAAIFFVALLLLPLWLPHVPMFVRSGRKSGRIGNSSPPSTAKA